MALLTPAVLTAQLPLVDDWSLDEMSGLIANDVGPFGNHGTLVGYGTSGTWVTGRYGNALQFDGIDDYVDVARNGSALFGSRAQLTMQRGAPDANAAGAPTMAVFSEVTQAYCGS